MKNAITNTTINGSNHTNIFKKITAITIEIIINTKSLSVMHQSLFNPIFKHCTWNKNQKLIE